MPRTPTSRTDEPRPPEPRTSRSTRRTVILICVGALVALALVAIGSGRTLGPVFEIDTPGWDFEQPDVTREVEEPPEPESMQTMEPTQEGDNALGTALVYAFAVAIAILVAVVVLWIIRRTRQLLPGKRETAEEAPDEEMLDVEDAQSALDTAIASLDYAETPKDAVIDAWLALEHAVADAGIRRKDTQTTSEFVISVLGKVDLDQRELGLLAELYRRALFDDTPLNESERDSARKILGHLAAQVEEKL